MDDVVIISGVRTPIGKFQGSLEPFSAPQLGALAVREAVKRANVDPAQRVRKRGGGPWRVARDSTGGRDRNRLGGERMARIALAQRGGDRRHRRREQRRDDRLFGRLRRLT